MTKEDLLKPRYKVIAEDTSGRLTVGDILIEDDEIAVFWYNGEPFTRDRLDKYPHLFQPLPWYAERRPEDMPDFVKWNATNRKGIVQRARYDFENNVIYLDDSPMTYSNWIIAFDPATPEEHQTYINS